MTSKLNLAIFKEVYMQNNQNLDIDIRTLHKIDTIKEEHINKVKDKIKGATFEIPYRDWLDKKKPEVYNVPLDYCKFRKENGRIKDEVLSYETLSETEWGDTPFSPNKYEVLKKVSNSI